MSRATFGQPLQGWHQPDNEFIPDALRTLASLWSWAGLKPYSRRPHSEGAVANNTRTMCSGCSASTCCFGALEACGCKPSCRFSATNVRWYFCLLGSSASVSYAFATSWPPNLNLPQCHGGPCLERLRRTTFVRVAL